jgi:multisubunit Na+/H+ antiporter MnhB subunit
MAQMTMSGKSVVKTTGAILLLMIYDHFNEKKDLLKEMNRLNPVFRFAVYVVSAIVVIALKVNNSYAQEFIYFKF